MEGKGCVSEPILHGDAYTKIMVNYSTGTLRIATVHATMKGSNCESPLGSKTCLVATCESFDLGTDGIKDSSTGVVDGHLIEGARDTIEQSATLFTGKLKEVVVMAESPAQFHTVFWLILAGSAVLCTIRLVGHVWLAVNEIIKKSADPPSKDHQDKSKGGDRYKTVATEEAIANLKKRSARTHPGREATLEAWKEGK